MKELKVVLKSTSVPEDQQSKTWTLKPIFFDNNGLVVDDVIVTTTTGAVVDELVSSFEVIRHPSSLDLCFKPRVLFRK